MKQSMIGVLVTMVILGIFLFPKIEEENEVHFKKTDIPFYQVRLEGGFAIERSFIFFEPKIMNEILDYGLGYKHDVDLSKMNQNEIIYQNKTIHLSEVKTEESQIYHKVNINQANFKELLTIPGITETKAASLIIHSKFKSIDELIHVKHIGPATLEKIRPYITI